MVEKGCERTKNDRLEERFSGGEGWEVYEGVEQTNM